MARVKRLEKDLMELGSIGWCEAMVWIGQLIHPPMRTLEVLSRAGWKKPDLEPELIL
jgi:hypothetical protein